MRNLATGLALGFALGLLLSSVADVLDGGGFPTLRLILSGILVVGIVFEIARVRKPGIASSARSERHRSPVS